MASPIIEVQHLGKHYRLGQIGMTSLKDDVQRAWDTLRRRSRPSYEDRDKGPTGFWALDDVSFDVQPGEVFGVIGKNGAGKSTLLKLLSRITEPTRGQAILRGRVGSLLEVGTGFHPELSGRENIFLNGAILGMRKREIAAKFDEIVAFAEVEKFIDTPVKRYSSGMYVRLAFAVAAHLEPEILIVDEVLAVGDAKFQKRCIDQMRKISENDGRTVLLVSHQMDTILRLCHRAVLLEAGNVKAIGTPDEIVPLYYQETDAVIGPDTELDLSKHPRNGSGGASFSSFRYEILSEPKVSYPYPGCSIRFTITIDAEERQDIGGLSLYFETEGGVKLFNFDLQRQQAVTSLEAGRNIFTVETPPLPINAMQIKASLWMADPSKTVVLDHLQGLCRLDFIEVLSDDTPSSKQGDSLVLLPETKLSVVPISA